MGGARRKDWIFSIRGGAKSYIKRGGALFFFGHSSFNYSFFFFSFSFSFFLFLACKYRVMACSHPTTTVPVCQGRGKSYCLVHRRYFETSWCPECSSGKR
ncbi:hypothetical protein BC940DRAFT_247763 [Gongronella butleri]|nr:hypothetical protein BC940DRAFT_247763 [Gongronella butleri]